MASLRGLLDRFLFSAAISTRAAPHVRDGINIQHVINTFVLASLPCALIGWWNLGEQIHYTMGFVGLETAPGIPGQIMAALGADFDPGSLWQCTLHGLLYFLPLFMWRSSRPLSGK